MRVRRGCGGGGMVDEWREHRGEYEDKYAGSSRGKVTVLCDGSFV